MDKKQIRDMLLREKIEEKKDPKYQTGYVDGVLDMYNEGEKDGK